MDKMVDVRVKRVIGFWKDFGLGVKMGGGV